MSSIKYSQAARADLTRLYDFLAQYDDKIADRGIAAILQAIDYIALYPLSGAPLAKRRNVRKSVVNFGATGYLVFHKRYEEKDTNLIARIIHQKEWYDASSIGLAEEKTPEAKAAKP